LIGVTCSARTWNISLFEVRAVLAHRKACRSLLRVLPGGEDRHSLIVHSEIYQDDHRYLEYCFEKSTRGIFKSTCLFDPVADNTPERIEQIYRRYPTRIIGCASTF